MNICLIFQLKILIFFKKFDLRIVEVEHMNVKGGSLRFIISHLSNKTLIKNNTLFKKSIDLEKKKNSS